MVFARVAGQVAALVASEKAVVRTAEKGVSMTVCTVASINRRGRELKGTLSVGLDLRAVEEVLDRFDVDSSGTACWRKAALVFDGQTEHDTDTLAAAHMSATC